MFPELEQALAAVPAGRYAVGVSGGADSVALLTALVLLRPDLSLDVAHLDHEWRGRASADDAAFVAALADRLGIACTIYRRSEIERRAAPGSAPANVEARGRAARLALFQAVVARHELAGVILAHQRDDQAETVLMRLLRGGGEATLGGIRPVATLDGLTVLRPLLGVPRDRLRAWLASIGQPFREDASNADRTFARNRVRRLLAARRGLTDPLIDLAAACDGLNCWLGAAAPRLAAEFRVKDLSRPSPPLARRAAARWLVRHAGCPYRDCDAAVAARLVEMCRDAAAAPRADFPGGATVRRRGGIIAVVRAAQPAKTRVTSSAASSPAASSPSRPSGGPAPAADAPPALPGS